MRRSLVGFESPNFGHAFLDGFEDLDAREEDKEDNYFGEDSQSLTRGTPRGARAGVGVGGETARARPRTLAASEGVALSNASVGGGLRDISTSKWKDSNSPGDGGHFLNSLNLEPEPSLDDLLVSAPPEWALCCVCHECGHSFCYDCIFEVIHRKGTCPLCRHSIGMNDITDNKQASQAINGLVVRCKYGLRLVSSPSLPIVSSYSPSYEIPSSVPSSPSSSSTSPPSSSNSTSTTTTTTTTTTITTTASRSSPIAIRASSHSQPSLHHARSLPSTLPSFMRTAAKWSMQPNACEATFTLAQQPAHEADCPFRPVLCYNDGCNEKVRSKDLENHMESCSRRVVQCIDCKQMFLQVDESSHSQSCPDQENCNVKVRRKEQTDHLTVCTNVEITCAHAQYGCTFKGIRAAYGDHQAVCMFKGLATVLGGLTQQISQLTLVNQNQAHTIATLQQELRAVQAQVREQASEIRVLREASSSSSSRSSIFGREYA